MDFGDAAYQAFLTQLRKLSFCKVERILKNRHDLLSIIDKDGVRIPREHPSFGVVFDSLKTEEEKKAAKPEYSYFCGFANDVFFRKSAQSDRRVRFLPIIDDPEYLCDLPELGDYLMGETELSPDPEEGWRFVCWTRLHRQDYRLVQIIFGQAQFSDDKLEAKLTVDYKGRRDRQLFLLAKALHFRDVAFFVDLARRGEMVWSEKHACSIKEWLHCHVAPLLPDFVEKCLAS